MLYGGIHTGGIGVEEGVFENCSRRNGPGGHGWLPKRPPIPDHGVSSISPLNPILPFSFGSVRQVQRGKPRIPALAELQYLDTASTKLFDRTGTRSRRASLSYASLSMLIPSSVRWLRFRGAALATAMKTRRMHERSNWYYVKLSVPYRLAYRVQYIHTQLCLVLTPNLKDLII